MKDSNKYAGKAFEELAKEDPEGASILLRSIQEGLKDMSKTHDYFLSAEAARERCRRKGPHDKLPMTREEEIKAWYDPSDDTKDATTDDREDDE